MSYFWVIASAFISCWILAKAITLYSAGKSFGYFHQKYMFTILIFGSTLICSLAVLIGLLIKDLL